MTDNSGRDEVKQILAVLVLIVGMSILFLVCNLGGFLD